MNEGSPFASPEAPQAIPAAQSTDRSIGGGALYGAMMGVVGAVLSGWTALGFMVLFDALETTGGFELNNLIESVVFVWLLGVMFSVFITVPIGGVVGLVAGVAMAALRLERIAPQVGAVTGVVVLRMMLGTELVQAGAAALVLGAVLAVVVAAIGWWVGRLYRDRMLSTAT